MSHSDYYRDTRSGLTLYAQKLGDRSSDTIEGSPVSGDDTLYKFDLLDDATDYEVFEQVGEEPDASDIAIALLPSISVTQSGGGGGGSGSTGNETSLHTVRQNLLDRIVEVTAQPKPNYNIEGQQVSWASYLDTLTKQLARIEQLIDDDDARNDGPFEIVSQGCT